MFLQILEVTTIGFPFCVFKILSGIVFGKAWLLLFGVLDASMNFVNLFGIIIWKRRILNTCLMSSIVGFFKKEKGEQGLKWEDFGNSIDVLFSFVLVAIMIAGNQIKNLSAQQLLFWNLAVVFNVLGAGFGRLAESIKKLPKS